MAPADNLSPAGSSTYQSNTLYVGDGTWDSTKNNFLMPNLVGLNFATMQYNGMGNRFSSMTDYHTLIKGHGVIAVIVFLILLPISVLLSKFRVRNPGSGVKFHIYLGIMSLLLGTVVFILGNFAVGPRRSLTNPHHGIGVAIYVLLILNVLGGSWVRGRIQKHPPRRLPVKLMLHQWFGWLVVLLGIIQVPLGLTLYGSPKWTFVLYTLWMVFLLLLYFIFTWQAGKYYYDGGRYSHDHGGTTVIEERRESGGIGRFLAPLAAGGAIAALLARRNKNKERDDVNRRGSVAEVIPSRRGSRRGSRRDSESFIEEGKIEDRRESGGIMDKLLGAGAVLGVGALAKSFFDRRKESRADEEYSAVSQHTPNRLRRSRRPDDSVLSDESHEVRRTDRRSGAILPGPGDPLATAAAIGAAHSGRPRTPIASGRPIGRSRRSSITDLSQSHDTTLSPPRRVEPREKEESHTLRNTVLGGIGLGWMAKKFRDRREQKEQDRVDELRERERRDEIRLESDRRHGHTPSRFTGDGAPPRSQRRVAEEDESDLSLSTVDHRRPIAPPVPIGAAAAAGGLAAAALAGSRSRHEVVSPVPMPTSGPRRMEPEFHESGSEAYVSSGGRQHRRHSSGRGRAAEAAVAGAGAAVAAEELERTRRERSRTSEGAPNPPVALKMQMHGDRKGNVTFRRLTEEEAAAERQPRHARSDSVSSLSGAETASRNRRYRREASLRRDAEIDAERRTEAGVASPPTTLSPPRPAFAGGRRPKDSSYYSGAPPAAGSYASPDSYGSRSGIGSPVGTAKTGEHELSPAERRQRRRTERNQRLSGGAVDYN